MADFLSGMSGGRKQQWLRQNRQVVLEYMREHGDFATREHFHISTMTWDSFLSKDPEKFDYDRMTKSDRALYISQNTNDRVVELGHEVARLRRQITSLMPAIQMMYAVSAVLKMAESLPVLPKDDFDSKSEIRS